MLAVLINETVKKYLLKQPGNVKKRIREKFEYLETGLWEGGLKVKKMKGISSKCVFEARIDRENRILFTLGSMSRAGGEKLQIIYIWGIVTHDDVSRKYRSIIPSNVPFLQFNDYNETEIENIIIEDLEPFYFTQEGITEKIEDESGSQKWFPVEETEWKRIQSYPDEDLELFLYLTPEQKNILNSTLPIMISGTAGSGKTTLCVYYLLNRALDKKKKAFITYNKHLKNFAQNLYNGLLIECPWKKDVIPPDFYTFKEICLQIAHNRRFNPENEVDFDRFNRVFSANPLYHTFDPELVWEEIRSIIKGAVLRYKPNTIQKAHKAIQGGNIDAPLLKQLQNQFILFARLESFSAVNHTIQKYLKTDIQHFAAHIEKFIDLNKDIKPVQAILEKTLHILSKEHNKESNYLTYLQYELMGKKKAPNFLFNRKEIYRIFEWYQNKLESENLWDELDLASQVDTEKYSYDVLACDEIQDFTDTQLDVLFNLVSNPSQLFLAGDTKQTINPSSFRWEEVRNHFYERGIAVPDLKTLTLNFRSSGSIVELSNVLLELKEKFTGKKAEESKEEWKYKGRPVTVVSGIAQREVIGIFKAAGAQRTILVRSESERDNLKKLLETELVFTIKEAKGLEFETVVLWKFCKDKSSTDIWKVALEINDKRIHEAKIRHEINLLYVGITRPRKDLIIYDGETVSIIWENDIIKDYVYITNDRKFIEGLWNTVSTPGEWIEQGHYFFVREYFKAAAECFKNGGDLKNTAKANAFYFKKIGRWAEAASAFEEINEPREAAENYEKAADFKNALRLWEKLHYTEHIQLCLVEVLKSEKKFAEAGKLYVKMNNYPAAAACFKEAKEYKMAGDIYLKVLKNKKEALIAYENGRNWLEAAKLYGEQKWYEKAADAFFKAKKFKDAEKYWIKSKNKNRLIEFFETTDQKEKLVALFEKEKNFDSSLKWLKKSGKDKTTLLQEAELYLKKGKYFSALTRFHVNNDLPGIGKCYFYMKKYKEALVHLEKAGEFYLAGDCLIKFHQYSKAAIYFSKSEEDEKNDFEKTRLAIKKINFFDEVNINELVAYRDELLYKLSDYKKALLFFQSRRFSPEEGLCYALMGKKNKAFECWDSCQFLGQWDQIAHICIRKKIGDIAVEFFLSGSRTLRKKLVDMALYESEAEVDHIIQLMDDYFHQNPTSPLMLQWGKMLTSYPMGITTTVKTIYYLDKCGEYNRLLLYIKQLQFKSKNDVGKGIPKIAKKAIEILKESKSPELSVLRFMLADQPDEVNRLLSLLDIDSNNYFYLTEGDIVSQKKAFDWAVRENKTVKLENYLGESFENRKLALFYEHLGNLDSAAKTYKYLGDIQKACDLFEQTGKYNAAGDIYFSSKKYKNALEMFQKNDPPDFLRLAQTYVKLKDYTAALSLYEKLGDVKAAAFCKNKLLGTTHKKENKSASPTSTPWF